MSLSNETPPNEVLPSDIGRSEIAHSEIELLAPAGNWQCARAAVENGADAIYFGLDVGFNARARAANFHLRELPKLMDMLHRQAVRGYVTLNTLVFTDELPVLEENLRKLGDAGVDAVLVQDLGVVRVVRELCPDLQIHASTQMTLTNARAIELAGQLGIERVVLPRELSLAEIRKIAGETKMPLEVFVHGALCVAYSGQCLTSESFGGRSANRGQCAQACRLPYDLFCDGEQRDLGDVKYLLSPQDLAAHDLVPSLLDAGVCSLKIEGRLKTAEYVANVCSHYRSAIDAALAGRSCKLNATQRRELELSFSRGFSPGWLEGCDHKRLVPGLSSAKRGVRLGVVESVGQDTMQIELEAPLRTGDGVVVSEDRFAGREIGGRVYELFQDGETISEATAGTVKVALQRGALVDQQNLVGKTIWKTDDPKLTKRLRRSFDSADPRKRVPVDLSVSISTGVPIRLKASIPAASGVLGAEVEILSEFLPERARKHPVTEELLRQQFERLGGSVYRMGKLTAHIQGQPMIPHSVLGLLRKELVSKLDRERRTRPLACAVEPVTARLLADAKECVDSSAAAEVDIAAVDGGEPPKMRVLCRSMTQLEQGLEAGVENLIADFHDIRQYRDAVRLAHRSDATIELATLRIDKPGESGLFRALHKHGADGWLARNLSAVQYCRKHQIPVACDFSLNVTNPLSAQQLMHWGAGRITASYDMNREQLLELVEHMPAQWLEVVIHQHMPMFHMEHCVFCSVLSPGRSKSDCGRPCDRHDVSLRDRVGAMHVLHADIGCRNTLYNGTAQSGAEAVAPLLASGVRQFRVELLGDTPAEVTVQLVNLYRSLLLGERSGGDVWRELKADNRVGVTRGTLEQPRNPLAIL